MHESPSSSAAAKSAQSEAPRSDSRHREASDQVELGSGRPHDTETPDIETSSDEYARTRFGGAVGRWLLEQQSNLLNELLAKTGSESLRILEVGGGHAQVTALLLERGHDVVVQGSDSACFRRLEPLLARYPGRLRTCASSLWRLPFAEREFDMVAAVRLMGHVVRWRELLAEMARVSNRYLLIEFARASNPLLPMFAITIYALKRKVEGTTRPFYGYREEAIVAELEAHAFRRLAGGAQFALPMVLHRLAGSPEFSARVEGTLRQLGLGDRGRSPAILLAERAGRARRSP